MAYTYKDLLKAYEAVGIRRGQLVYVVSELWRLRSFEDNSGDAIPRAHYTALRELLGPNGTIAVSTSSTNICNTDTVFDPAMTPSYNVGIFSEYVRNLPDAKRSFHPFVSYTAIGPLAEAITANVSPHAYGPETPESRMIEHGARTISIGMSPDIACSTAHHVEHIVGVPFRYMKEFEHPVLRDGHVQRELFYMHVWYRDTGMIKDRYIALFEALKADLEILSAKIGAGNIYSYSMSDFCRHASRIIALNNYISCKVEPVTRPYRT